MNNNYNLLPVHKRAFSIAEIVISMALIVMLSVAGFTACYVGLAIQKRATQNLEIWNNVEGIRSAFISCYDSKGKPQTDEDIKNFVIDFNKRMAFNLDIWEPNVNKFQGAYNLNSSAWEINLILDSQEIIVAPENPGDEATTEILVISGLDFSYFGAYGQNPSYEFSYRYYTDEMEVSVTLNLRVEFYIEIKGFTKGSTVPSYTVKEVMV